MTTTKPQPHEDLDLDPEFVKDLEPNPRAATDVRGGLSKSCGVKTLPNPTATCTCFSTIY